MNDSKRLFGSIVLAVALFFFWPVVIGGFGKISALRTAVSDRQDLLDKRKAILASVDTAYTDYRQNIKDSDATKFAALVPVHKSEAEIVSALQGIATSTGVQVDKISMAEANDARGGYKALSLTFELIGSYAGLKQYLSSLEVYVRLLNVLNINAMVDDKTGQIHFAVQAETYYLK